MATQNISLDNADTSSVVYEENGVDKEVCYLVIDGQEVWRKNPRMPNVYIRRNQRGPQNQTSHTTIYNPGYGFTSPSQVTGFLNGSLATDNIGLTGTFGEPKKRNIEWQGCTLNSTGGIATIYAANSTRSDYLSVQSTGVEDDDDEGDKSYSWILGNKGTILVPYTIYTYPSNYGYYAGRTVVRRTTSFTNSYVLVNASFSNRSDVVLQGSSTLMRLSTFESVNAEITGHVCGESFAYLSIYATEAGGYGD